MTTSTALRTALVGTPLAFAALLTLHPKGGTGDFYTGVADNVGPWLTVHYGAALLFPAMALVVWLLLRGLSSRAATVARFALPVYAVFYGVYETVMGVATGVAAQTGNGLSGAEREGVADVVNNILTSRIVGDGGLFSSVGSIAWWVGISAAIMALRQAGASRASLVLLGLGGLMVFHALAVGPAALVCLSAAAYLIERRRPRTERVQSFSNFPSGSSSARAA
jgi:hypothetical protein